MKLIGGNPAPIVFSDLERLQFFTFMSDPTNVYLLLFGETVVNMTDQSVSSWDLEDQRPLRLLTANYNVTGSKLYGNLANGDTFTVGEGKFPDDTLVKVEGGAVFLANGVTRSVDSLTPVFNVNEGHFFSGYFYEGEIEQLMAEIMDFEVEENDGEVLEFEESGLEPLDDADVGEND